MVECLHNKLYLLSNHRNQQVNFSVVYEIQFFFHSLEKVLKPFLNIDGQLLIVRQLKNYLSEMDDKTLLL